jgi:uroporphyrinogen-III synthase
LLDHALRDGVTTLLHLAGGDHRAVANPAIQVKRRIVYAMRATRGLPAGAKAALAAGEAEWVLLHSPRAAARFAMLVDRARVDRSVIAIAALSPAVASAAGEGWRKVAVAARPNDTALLAAAGLLCDKAGG